MGNNTALLSQVGRTQQRECLWVCLPPVHTFHFFGVTLLSFVRWGEAVCGCLPSEAGCDVLFHIYGFAGFQAGSAAGDGAARVYRVKPVV